MTRNRVSTRSLLESAADITADDGQDPKVFFDRRLWGESPPKPGRKALQLCGQVRDALHGVFARMADDDVRDCTVVSVEPAPHAGRLMVTVAVPTADAADRTRVAARLAAAASAIRREMAPAIHRRKVPELAFRVA